MKNNFEGKIAKNINKKIKVSKTLSNLDILGALVCNLGVIAYASRSRNFVSSTNFYFEIKFFPDSPDAFLPKTLQYKRTLI